MANFPTDIGSGHLYIIDDWPEADAAVAAIPACLPLIPAKARESGNPSEAAKSWVPAFASLSRGRAGRNV